jgi:hypothetical protein
MGFAWSISHESGLVVAAGEGLVMPHDIDRFLSALTAGHAASYRKLIDLTGAVLVSTPADACAFGTLVHGQGERSLVAPAAIAVSSEALEIVDQFQLPGQSDHPIRIFPDMTQAREWLQAISSPSSGMSK